MYFNWVFQITFSFLFGIFGALVLVYYELLHLLHRNFEFLYLTNWLVVNFCLLFVTLPNFLSCEFCKYIINICMYLFILWLQNL